MLDLYVQFVFKQGQIELEAKPAELPPSEYRNTNAELIHRREVENLNKSIIVNCPILDLLSFSPSCSFRNQPTWRFVRWINRSMSVMNCIRWNGKAMDTTRSRGHCSLRREKEKLTYEIADLKQRAQDITFLKVTRNVQEYLACSNDSAFEAQKQRESQMLETTIAKMKEVGVSLSVCNGDSPMASIFF